MVKVEGTLSRVVFANADSGFAVIRLQRKDDGEQITAVGPLAHVGLGEDLTLWGRWVTDPRHGLQLKVSECLHHPPTSATGIERYLASGLVKGIGPSTAKKLVETFGVETLQVMENQPERLNEIRGLGRKRLLKIQESFAAQKDLRELMVFLAAHGVSRNLSLSIHRQYHDRALAVVQKDPYRLIRDIRGVGFKTADNLARRLGLPADAPDRILAAGDHALQAATVQGHCFLPRAQLVRDAAQLVGLPPEAVDTKMDLGQRSMQLEVEEAPAEAPPGAPPDWTPSPLVYPVDLHQAECTVAQIVAELIASPAVLSRQQVDAGLVQVESRQALAFHPLQREAMNRLCEGNLLVVTGGPGTGKTTLLQGIIEILRHAGLSFSLAAPTGRAAKRMEESTGFPSHTLHRLLRYQPRGGFMVNPGAPLIVQACVIDEASMVDVNLFCALLRGLRPGTLLVLVGDVDQLPSIGPGAVLSDLIEAGVPTVHLTHVFRQSSESLIIRNAHRINRGELPEFPPRDQPGADFFFVERDSPAGIVETVLELVSERIPRRFGFDPKTDVQVLVPMYRGEVGVENLNKQLRDRLNGPARPEEDGGTGLRPGDKVLQTVNDYDREVTNGDIGLVIADDAESNSVLVEFEGRRVGYTAENLDQLALAYAVSVHKSQGSEYPAVVIPLHTQHFLLLQRNLLYTALTRARKLAVLVGSRRALELAIQNKQSQQRFTQLTRRVREELALLVPQKS